MSLNKIQVHDITEWKEANEQAGVKNKWGMSIKCHFEVCGLELGLLFLGKNRTMFKWVLGC
jgi:hypothetical protein